MTALSAPRHPLISRALDDARAWCAGHTIDDRPALVHAVRVAETLGRHAPAAGPHLICAALLHDSPEFAPAEPDLDATLTHRYGPETTPHRPRTSTRTRIAGPGQSAGRNR